MSICSSTVSSAENVFACCNKVVRIINSEQELQGYGIICDVVYASGCGPCDEGTDTFYYYSTLHKDGFVGSPGDDLELTDEKTPQEVAELLGPWFWTSDFSCPIHDIAEFRHEMNLVKP
jgi:hypothetical protein